MSSLTVDIVLRALDGLSMRSVATAHNIANANSEGFRPVQVSFEVALARAAADGGERLSAFRPVVEMAEPGSGVRVDLEMETASETAARYSALVEIMNRQLQINALALSGGR